MNTYRFNVLFDSSTKNITTEGLDGSTFPIQAPQGINLITFTLDKHSGAQFSGTPIQWLQNGLPADLPPWFQMHLHNPHHFALWDFNAEPAESQHPFVFSVFFEGQFYPSHDPTIINEPPIPT